MDRKVVLVTGGAAGIGLATVSLFIREGWEVVSIDQVEQSMEGSDYFQCDLGNNEEINALVAKIKKTYSHLDALINNAAEQLCASLTNTEVTEWDRIMAVNVRAAYQLGTGCFPLLRAKNGSIVNVSSVHAQVTSEGMGAYAASKAALASLTRSMALEFASDGVRVNAIMPGAIETSMLRDGLSRSSSQARDSKRKSPQEILAEQHPLKRVGRTDEVAQAILFLADSVRSSFITGQSLIVDGGACARLSTE
ncbi:MAG: SDR family oxidoreductase [Verrucomicrobiota bacterium]|nr:SDR family oxidoreductase [Verrucomicrobiota bacterium]